jgi:hypothetical protein
VKADGSILIDTKIIDGGMEKGFELIKDEMSSVGITAKQVGKQIELSFSKMDVSKPIANAVAKVEQLENQLAAVTSDFKISIEENDDKSAERLAAKRVAIYEKLEAAREKLSIELAAAVQREAEAEEKASQREIRAAEKEAKAKQRLAKKQFNDLARPAKRFNSRLREIVSGALVFNLISSGMREFKSYFGKALKTNTEFSASLAQLKGALLTAFQPIYEVVLPAILILIRVLTALVQVIGSFFAAISGKSSAQMKKNAKALNKQAGAIGGVGDAAEKAAKQLMGFDEINRLESTKTEAGGGGGGGIGDMAANFESMEITPELERILALVGAIGAGLLAWKIASMFTDSLKLAAGIGLAVGGALLYAYNWADAFANGIDWGNFAGMLVGAIAAVAGLALVFGPAGAAVGLLVAGIGLLVLGLKDWIEKGELTNEACAAIVAGVTAIGAAISLLTGSWIPVAIAAVAAFVFAAITKGEEIKTALNKLGVWLKDVFWRDWTEVFGVGLGTVMNTFVGIMAGILSGIKTLLFGLIDFLQLAFAGDWAAIWNGLASMAKNAVNGIISVVNAMIAAVVTAINSLFALLSVNIPLPGGGSIEFTLPQFSAPQIPYLAKGAVLPANKPFLAMVGDQKHGTNVEAPLETIKQALAEVMNQYGGGDVQVVFSGELAALGRVLAPVVTKAQRENNRGRGGNL